MKSVYQCSSANEYLFEAFKTAKQSTPGLSVEKYADRLGLGRSTLKMILSGKRNLTISHVHRIASSLKLSSVETDYLQAIILKNRAKAPAEKRYYSKKIKEVKEDAKISSVLVSNKELLSDPYFLPLLVYLTEFNPKDQPLDIDKIKVIAGLLNLQVDRVQAIIDKLIQSGVIQQRDDGQDVHYVFDKLTHIVNQGAYLKSWLVESSAKIDSGYRDTNNFFNASTFSLCKEDLPKLINDLKAVFEKYMGIPEHFRKKTLLIQANVQLFPVLDTSKDP